MSVAGGYYRAVEAATVLGMDTVQIFTKNNNQWRAKPITSDEADRFKVALREQNITHPLSHSSYLINLASPDDELWKKSIDTFVVELQRAEQLAIPYVVLHPGSYTTSSEEAGLKRVAAALDEVHAQTRGLAVGCLLENTAGQGSNLGWQFEQLAAIIDMSADPDRLGVCLDTCHAFAAGYAMQTEKQFKATLRRFHQTVGVDRIRAFHLNDSKRELGSRVDRHEHIGHGHLGLEPFRHLLNDRRFRHTPMYLETPKGTERGEDWDAINLHTLRELIGG
jgi:deoxyribonuclease-4